MRLFAGSQRLAELVPILLMASMCFGQALGTREGRTATEEYTLETGIAGILAKAGVPGSLQYSGDCRSRLSQFPPANIVWDQDKATLQILRKVFSADPKMQITQEGDGTIRMTEKDVPSDLLNVRIRRLPFNGVYRTDDALAVILSAPEVRSFMRDHQIRLVPNDLGLRQPITQGMPYISGYLEGVTISQALDYVLRTFPGYWVYESCSDQPPGWAYLRFIQDGSKPSNSEQQSMSPAPSIQIVKPVLEILQAFKVSASLIFSGQCKLPDFPDFPRIRPPLTGGGSAVQMLREMFRDDPKIQVTEGSDGMIRIAEAGVPDDLLNMRIPSFQTAVYIPDDALRAIVNTRDVQTFAKDHNISWAGAGGELVRGAPGPTGESPRILGFRDNVTVSQALDQVTKAFPGIWIYENCPISNTASMVYFRSFRLQKIELGEVVIQ